MSDIRDTLNSWEITALTHTWVRRLQAQQHPNLDSLIVIQGPAEYIGLRIPLDRAAGTIGIARGPIEETRGAAEAIMLPSRYVGQRHAELEATMHGWHLRPASEERRIYVGRHRVENHRLAYGDEIRVGEFVLLFIPASVEDIPISVVDPDTGLLNSAVFRGELMRLAEEHVQNSEQDFGLVLVRIDGLRTAAMAGEYVSATQVAEGAQVERSESIPLRLLGRTLLHVVPEGVPLARLESNLFAAAWSSVSYAQLLEFSRALSRAVVEVGLPYRLKPPTVVLAARGGRSLSGHHVLTCAVSTLDELMEGQRGTIVEADLDTTGSLLQDDELLSALGQSKKAQITLVTIQDEDYLRIQLGNQRLAGLRWNLRRAVQQALPGEVLWGLLEDRVVVVCCPRSQPVAKQIREKFSKYAPHLLQFVSLELDPIPSDAGDLRRRLLLAAENPGDDFAAGHREAVDKLPTPIAGPYGLIWVVTSEVARLKTALDTLESALRFMAHVMLTSAAHDPDMRPRLAEIVGRRKQERLPLGEWLALVRELGPCLTALDHPVVSAVFRSSVGGRRRQRLAHLAEKELLPFRNHFAHGSIGVTDSLAGERAKELIPRLNAIVQALSPLRETELVSIVSQEPRRYTTRVRLRILTGSRDNFEVRTIDSRSSEYINDSCYLVSSDYTSMIELDPLLKFHLCPQCEREELFLATHVPRVGEDLTMHGVTTGHRWKWKTTEDDFPPPLKEIL